MLVMIRMMLKLFCMYWKVVATAMATKMEMFAIALNLGHSSFLKLFQK